MSTLSSASFWHYMSMVWVEENFEKATGKSDRKKQQEKATPKSDTKMWDFEKFHEREEDLGT